MYSTKEKYKIDINEYKLIDNINQGTFSQIYLIENKQTKEKYAAKVNLIKIDNETDQEKEFIYKEFEILIRVKHPTLNSYTGISFNDFNNRKNMTILMDQMARGSLSLIIDTEQFEACQYGYDNTKRQIILVGICYGMMFLHKNRILHRDLKPENVLIDDKYRPKLTDYGLTKIFDPHNIMSQPAAGYPIFTYMAPEVLRGNHFNPKSDVYSFGILMYEIIFGCRSFSDVIYKKGLNNTQLKAKILKGLRPEFKKPIKKGLRRLIERCWSKNPTERPTFSELFNKLSLTSEEFDAPIDEILNENEDDSQKYCLEDVNKSEVLSYVEEIRSEADKEAKMEAEIDSLKKEIATLHTTIENQSNEIENMKHKAQMQIDHINSQFENEHVEVQIMRDFIVKQVRNEFLESKKHSKPGVLLVNLDYMFGDSNIVKLFSEFCHNKLCPEYIYYIEDMAAYYNMKEDLKPLLFYDFRDKYFKDGAPYFLNIKSNLIKEVCEAKEPSPGLLDKALDQVYAVFKVELIREFKYSPFFAEYMLSHPKKRKRRSSKKVLK